VITNMVNAAEEFPEGAVVAIDYALADDELERQIVEVVENDLARARLRQPAAALARSATYEALAEHFLAAVDRLITAAPHPRRSYGTIDAT
jgi:hypothetical protein